MRESEIHSAFAHWLDAQKIPYRHDRTDKKTRTIPGEPDFLVTREGRCLYIEVKVIGAKLSPDQVARRKYLMDAGNIVEVAYNVEECIFAVETLLPSEKRAGRASRPGKCHSVTSYQGID